MLSNDVYEDATACLIQYRVLTHIYGILKGGTDEPICRAVVEMQTCGHGGRGGQDKLRVAFKHMHSHM